MLIFQRQINCLKFSSIKYYYKLKNYEKMRHKIILYDIIGI